MDQADEIAAQFMERVKKDASLKLPEARKSIARTLREYAAEAVREEREQCIALLCQRCASGDKPKLIPGLGGYVHIWKIGNGHSVCGAAQIREGEK